MKTLLIASTLLLIYAVSASGRCRLAEYPDRYVVTCDGDGQSLAPPMKTNPQNRYAARRRRPPMAERDSAKAAREALIQEQLQKTNELHETVK